MDNNKFQNKYRIPSARAVWHDYSGGTYFVTVCTKDRAHYFGEIIHCRDVACRVSTMVRRVHTMAEQCEPQLQLTPVGQFLAEQIANISAHYPYAEIPLFTVMPNHFHVIAFIDGEKIPYLRRDTERLGMFANDTIKNEKMQEIARFQGWLSVAIGGVKSSVTKFARANGIEFAWQPRFDDRIIRNQEEMNRIADYIEHNVARWDMDCFNE